MKRIRINQGHVGLVYKNGDYQKVLTAGTYWLGFNQTVVKYHLGVQFVSQTSLEIFQEDKTLMAMLEVVEVADNEIVIMHYNKKFHRILNSGRYLFWKGFVELSFQRIDLTKVEIIENVTQNLFNNYELSKYIRTFEVAVFEKAILLIDDVPVKTLGGGTYRFWRNDTTIKMLKVDTRQLQLEIAGQELLTKDKATVRINFYTQYKVINIEKALLANKEYEKQLYISMQLALRAFVGTYTLDELLDKKDNIAAIVMEAVKENANQLGVSVINCGIRDVILTGEMREIMNQVLVAQKKAQANIITRREETASTRSLLNTAKLMENNEMLFKLKEMEYVEKIADKIGEITVAGNGNVIKQLKEIFVAK